LGDGMLHHSIPKPSFYSSYFKQQADELLETIGMEQCRIVPENIKDTYMFIVNNLNISTLE
jgi:hypothetical protein